MNALSQKVIQWGEYLNDLGWWGVLGYAGIIFGIQLFCMPLSPAAIAAGIVFGAGRGFVAMMIGIIVGSAVNFLASRHLMRGVIARWLANHEKFRLIDGAIGREGWKIIALLRFCPIPFGLANYSFGLTSVAFLPYMFATFLAVMPSTFFFVWLGATSREAAGAVAGAGGPAAAVALGFKVLGLVAVFAAIGYVTKVARAAIAKGEAPAEAPRS